MSVALRCPNCASMLTFKGFVGADFDPESARAVYVCLASKPNGKGVRLLEQSEGDWVLHTPNEGSVRCDLAERFLYYSNGKEVGPSPHFLNPLGVAFSAKPKMKRGK